MSGWQDAEWREARDEQSAWEHVMSCTCRDCQEDEL